MAKLSPQGKFRGFDKNGNPLNSGNLHTYEAGTSTRKVTFKSASEVTPNTNPVILDGDGYANVYISSGSYKFVLEDSLGVNQWVSDDISTSDSNTLASSVVFQSTNLNLTTVFSGNHIIATSSITISLLAGSVATEGFIFSVQNTSSGNVTIDPDGAETIDGSSTFIIPSGGGGTIVCDGTNWQLLSMVTVSNNADNVFTGKMSTPDSGTLTIATGSITPIGIYHVIDTEASGATDNLDTISSGSDGQILVIRQNNDARDITITSIGNIALPNNSDIILNDTKDSVSFIYDANLTKWVVTSTSRIPSGALIGTKLLDSSGTYTKSANAKTVTVEVYGSGGGGGASSVGSGGTGGTTSFGTHITCTGGIGGSAGGVDFSGKSYGTGTGGDINVTGGGHNGGNSGSDYQGTGTDSTGQAGTSGGYSFKEFAVTALGATEVVTIGASGLAGTGTFNGGAGVKGKIIIKEYT